MYANWSIECTLQERDGDKKQKKGEKCENLDTLERKELRRQYASDKVLVEWSNIVWNSSTHTFLKLQLGWTRSFLKQTTPRSLPLQAAIGQMCAQKLSENVLSSEGTDTSISQHFIRAIQAYCSETFRMLSHRNLLDLVNATSGAGLLWLVWTGVKAVRWIKTKKWRFRCHQLCLFYNIPRKNWACWVIHQWSLSYNITVQKASIVSWSICWPLYMIWGLLQGLDMNQHHYSFETPETKNKHMSSINVLHNVLSVSRLGPPHVSSCSIEGAGRHNRSQWTVFIWLHYSLMYL